MSEDNKYMDDSFRRMNEELNASSYDPAFWSNASSMLDDDALDNAFREAADSFDVPFSAEVMSNDLNDAFMDEEFREAANNQEATYDASYWEEFESKEADLQMDDSFVDAASTTTTPYSSAYWNEANVALEEEGLHYEYKSDYWEEARQMLDRADRRTFFYRWSGVATLLLLISVFGGSMFDTVPGDHLTEPGIAISEEGQMDDLMVKSDIVLQESIREENEEADNDAVNTAEQDENVMNSSYLQDRYANNDDRTNQNDIEERSEGDLDDEINERSDINEDISTNELSDNNELYIPLEFGNSKFVKANEKLNDIVKMEELERDFELEHGSGLPQSPINKIDNDQTVYSSPSLIPIEKKKIRPTNTLSLVAGIGLGNEYGANYIDPNWRTHAQLEFTHRPFGWLNRFEFGAGIGANHMRQSSLGAEKRSTQYFYNGGVSKSWFKLRLTDMFYANANVFVNFRLNKKHKLRVGAAYDHLVAVQSNMSFQMSSDDEIETVNNNWGVKDGMNKNDFRLSLGYEYRVNSKLAVQLNGNFGLSDRTDNIFLQNEVMDREMNVTLGLKYNLFRSF